MLTVSTFLDSLNRLVRTSAQDTSDSLPEPVLLGVGFERLHTSCLYDHDARLMHWRTVDRQVRP